MVPTESAKDPSGQAERPVLERLELTAATFSHVAFGVALPLVALLVEISTRWCAETFFDPIPTPFHAALVALVVVSNGACWCALYLSSRKPSRLLGWLSGISIGIASWYSLVFAPLTPLSLIALIAYLMGLLSLSPMLALLSAGILRRRLNKGGRVFSKASFFGGMAIGVALLAIPDLWSAHTLSLMTRAVGEGKEAGLAVRRLRSEGDRDEMLRWCYMRPSRLSSPISWFRDEQKGVSTEKARLIWYRVHGTPFTDEPRPDFRTGRSFFGDDDDFDRSAGSRDLSLASSSLEGSLDTDAALGYLEWNWVVANGNSWQQEGRATVALPHGAVVSRLTLWVNGEPREAAFAPRGKAIEAYDRVRNLRRDPVLVTTAGQDRIRIVCFPVPPNGEMRFRVGITVPLEVESAGETRLHLPWIVESNFSPKRPPAHAIRIKSDRPIRPAEGPLAAGILPSGVHAVRGTLTDRGLDTAEILGERDAAVRWAHAPDPENPSRVYRQSLAEPGPRPAARLAIVVDGSIGVAPAKESIAGMLEALPDATRFSLAIAGDVVESTPVTQATPEARRAAATRVRRFEFAGGCDSVLALEEGWDELITARGGVVLWICSRQPHRELPLLHGIRSRLAIPGPVTLLVAQIGRGENFLLSEVPESPRLGAVLLHSASALPAWAARQFGTQGGWTVARFQGDASAILPESSKRTSDHLARLADADECAVLLQNSVDADRAKATSIALKRRIVVPVTGAVVLETAEMEIAAGLTPGDPAHVPSVPEPGVLVLVAVAVAVLVARRFQRVRA